MYYVLILIFWGVLPFQSVGADEFSLGISKEDHEALQMESTLLAIPQSHSNDDFQEMDDFIKQENERLKDIKLLNLDLERANLELKRREIEQKMVQLNKADGAVSLEGEGDSDTQSNRPVIKLLGTFASASLKQAVLNVNGTSVHVKEGTDMDSFVVGSISPQAVIIQYEDGESQEFRLL
ncbi:MAG: hypothetical protein HQL15_08355 [Candidatus Omnitrophica bacterium]|nr:hypothetical protein [Candidatus Omnitrophota bacterium]